MTQPLQLLPAPAPDTQDTCGYLRAYISMYLCTRTSDISIYLCIRISVHASMYFALDLLVSRVGGWERLRARCMQRRA